MRASGFESREQAGDLLAEAVAKRNYLDPVVLALPRGGVPVAAKVATRLKAPLDVLLVRKIGAPMQPELAIGAVVDGEEPEVYRNETLIRQLGISEEEFEEVLQRQLAIIDERRRLWLEGRERPSAKNKTVIVIDDGIATGATLRASLRALKRRQPKSIVVAIPVAPPDAVESLRKEADEIICLQTPELFYAIGAFYADFSQVSDAEVSRLLKESENAHARQERGR